VIAPFCLSETNFSEDLITDLRLKNRTAVSESPPVSTVYKEGALPLLCDFFRSRTARAAESGSLRARANVRRLTEFERGRFDRGEGRGATARGELRRRLVLRRS